MRFFLCQVFPPLAVLSCGKPGVALLNLILFLWPWSSSRMHAMQVVSIYEEGRVMSKALGGSGRKAKALKPGKKEPAPNYDNPAVGENGTRFRRRSR